MPAFREETFGPVAALTRVRNLEEAIYLANDTVYGLGASVWTRDLDAARHIARRLEAGSVFVNGLVASDARMPMGGVKASGYGRELGAYGAREFTNVQTVRIGPGDGPG
jgi:succinate-semialdehyde dehydrogenase/glutarate-semialdehyde dehydrogenase